MTEIEYKELNGSEKNDVFSIHKGNHNCIVTGNKGFDYLVLNGTNNDWKFIISSEKESFCFINKSNQQEIIVSGIEAINFGSGDGIGGIKDNFNFQLDTEYALNECFIGIMDWQYSIIGRGGEWVSDYMY